MSFSFVTLGIERDIWLPTQALFCSSRNSFPFWGKKGCVTTEITAAEKIGSLKCKTSKKLFRPVFLFIDTR